MKNKKQNKKVKNISIIIIAIAIISCFVIINSFETVSKVVSRIDSLTFAKEGMVEENITGVVKQGSLNNFAENMPIGSVLFDRNKADTAIVGKEGYTLDNNGNQYIVKKDLKNSSQNFESAVTYLGPDGTGIPKTTEGYVTNTGIDKNATAENRSKFTMKFKDVVTMQDTSTKDVAITISNIYIINQRNDKVAIIPIWRGSGLSVSPRDSQQNELSVDGENSVAMQCDITISVLNDDGTPLEGESVLFEVKDLDINDKTRQGSDKSYLPKANDDRFNQNMTDEQKLVLYNSDYREGLYILKGALTDAYMPETNWLEVKRLSQGEYANGLRFSAYEKEDEGTLNTGFLTVIDSTETKFRWYGSAAIKGVGTALYTKSNNHHIKATSSIGGFIRTDFVFNYLTSADIITNTWNMPGKHGSFQHDFLDGSNVPYVMQADTGHYMEKITIDNNEFLPSDFSEVATGESEKTVKITKGEKEYTFVVSKDNDGNVIKADYIFENNNANHEISVKWNEITNSEYKVEYYYDGEIDNTKTETKEAEIGDTIENYTDKNIEGYKFEKVEGTPLTIDADSTKNIIKVYYVKRNDLSYKVNYLEKGTNNVLHTPKTVENQTYGMVINSQDEVIDIDDYKFSNADKETLTISIENNEINLYYEKEKAVTAIVKYYEKGTNNEIKPETILDEVKPDDIISAKDYNKEITGYIYDSAVPETLTITEDNNKNVLILYYVKKNDEANYTVNYLDKDTNKVIHEQKVAEKVKIDDVINAKDEVIEINNYKYDSSDKEKITIVEDNEKNVINLYYTKKNGSVIVKYIDEDTGKEIAKEDTITGKVDDEYTSKSKTIDGYDLTKNSGNTSGKIAEKDTTVIYYYKAKAKEVTPAKEEVNTLPKTGNASSFSIIIAIFAILGIVFAVGYHKLRDIK